MAAPADGTTTTTTTVDQDEASVVKTTTPLPRAIQLVMAIVWSVSESCPTTTTSPEMAIGDGDNAERRAFDYLWINIVCVPCSYVAVAAAWIYVIVGHEEVTSGAGGFCLLAIIVLQFAYLALLSAAAGHVGLFAPRTPYAAWEAFNRGSGSYDDDELGFIVASMITCLALLLQLSKPQAWPLLVPCTCLLGLLDASVVAFWLCILRTYGDGGTILRRIYGHGGGNSITLGETFIDGLAYLYCRLLYEFAARYHAVSNADDAAKQQPDDSSLV